MASDDPIARRNADRSRVPRPGASTSRRQIVGTAIMAVTRWRAIDSRMASGRGSRSRTTVAPTK
ncbi:MAG: hypothetical protein EB033_14455 [Proteobacteria bacterium]|nr:hypothetical protein [Pseudomonadota bacterium]NDG99155.1 hypothetical protein [Pseudomonadota bacterium]